MKPFRERHHLAPTSPSQRLFRAQWRQAALNPTCPTAPGLSGRLAFVTGGSNGIGFELSCGLAARGAEVIATGTSQASIERARGASASPATRGSVAYLPLNLADLPSVAAAIDALEATTRGRPLDILVLNAGVWPHAHARSAQGFEIAFATNVLGHFALVTSMLERALLAETARVVIVTGDIYILTNDCTPDYAYDGRIGGTLAYSRSKLGNLWMADELQRRHARLQVVKVHPGVVATNLVQAGGGIGRWFKRSFFIAAREGAQTPLIAATQPGYGEGVYLHNACGRMQLRDGDPALNATRAAALWDELTSIVALHRQAASGA